MLGNNIGDVGWPACGEIDVMEHVNTESRTYGTIHWQGTNGQYASYGGNTTVGVTGFHVYAIAAKELQETKTDNNFTIFPNPVKDELRIATSENLAGGLLRIYDIMGRQVLIATQAANRVNVAKLPSGVYTLLFTKDGKTITRRFY